MNLAIVRQQISNLLLELPELADDDVLRSDMLEAETDAHEFLRMLERRRQEAEHLTEAIAANITALSERKARMWRREEAMRKLMLKVMEAADLRKVELPKRRSAFAMAARRSSSTTRRPSRTSTAT